jgi:aminoglycoside 3-N-acetyltransferase
MITVESVSESLSSIGLSPEDTVVIHSDAGVAAQFEGKSGAEKLSKFINCLKQFFHSGTILVPSFTYSATKNEIFNPLSSKSDVGQFSEFFRTSDGVERTSHPIFSFSIWGKNKERFLAAKNTTCFGEGSLFDEVYKVNGKISCLGCSFDRITFIHFVEEKLGVYYRYFKTFEAKVQSGESVDTYETVYFVRDLNFDSTTDLTILRDTLLKKDNLKLSCLGRFPIVSVSAQDFVETASYLCASDKNSLIRQGKSYA